MVADQGWSKNKKYAIASILVAASVIILGAGRTSRSLASDYCRTSESLAADSRKSGSMSTFLDQTRDPQSLGKPTGFSGKDEDWQTWSIKFESWCGLQGLEASMEAAAAMTA